MLTRLEVNGFKNLLDVRVDFGPFTCIAGENGTGKSNLFDVIPFLALLADSSMTEAAEQVRGLNGERGGDVRDLFWDGCRTTEPRLKIAAEMIIPSNVEDEFGRPAEASMTLLRYELELRYLPPTGLDKIGRIALQSEDLRHINVGDAARHLPFPHHKFAFATEWSRVAVAAKPSSPPPSSTTNQS